MTSTRPPMLAADMIRELTRPYTTNEWVSQPQRTPEGKYRTVRRVHSVRHRPLLEQLHDVITGATSLSDEDAGRGTFGSKPAARVDAMDVLARIRCESTEYRQVLGMPRIAWRIEQATGVDYPRLLALSGRVGSGPDARVHRWWVAARVATQWDSPAWRPTGAPCPVEECEQFGTLRVKLSECVAYCTACGSVWDNQFAVENLGRHVAWSTSHDLAKPAHIVPVPVPTVDPSRLAPWVDAPCPECGPTRDAMAIRAVERHAVSHEAS